MAQHMHTKERDIILDSITEGVFTVDGNWRITSFNRAAETISGVPRDTAIGQLCKDILRADICEGECALRETIKTGKPIVGKAAAILDGDGNRRPISVSTAVVKDQRGEVVGGVETFRDLTMIEQLRKEIERDYGFEDILSRSDRMRKIFDVLPLIAESVSTVLLEGESGTGKELVARAIHNLSPRRKKPFVAINCGALPDTLLESELFGYKAGAFTDARKDKPGRIAIAQGGTLLLDEIGDISPALQVRLLRFLEERVYEPLGSVKSVKADVRVIAATNKNLSGLVAKGRFRQDLFYRVNVVRIELPPLWQRMEDIPLLVDHFIASLNSIQGKDVVGITDEALTCLMSYNYPGNVRELRNIVERAFVLCRSGEIERRCLPEPVCFAACINRLKQTEFMSLKQMEAAFLMNALRRNNWNRLQTAIQLGIHKTTLFRKIKSLGLQVPRSRKQS
ncbi:MAG: Fis family transcriptional regulator [Desulfobacterales bacterium S3730MH5]|nr:MAG: Fis family transcriptional regulator [Desulfobacterales bacterium S3730MH5]